MLGAIIGDIAGSRFERDPIQTKEFELITDECRMTDDSLMTIAVKRAIDDALQYDPDRSEKFFRGLSHYAIYHMQDLGRRYPDAGFGRGFAAWLNEDPPKPYNSFGNGSAMRISPVADFARDTEELRKTVHAVTAISHNHPEGLKGAQAIAMGGFMAKNGRSKAEIKNVLSSYYDLDFTLDERRKSYSFDATCQGSVPEAIVSFLESESFEDTLRNAISLGGDSDTLAAMAGGIAEHFYGIPEDLERFAKEKVAEVK